MHIEYIPDVRAGYRPVPPTSVSPENIQEAIIAIRQKKRIDSIDFLDRQKYAILRQLLAEVQHLDLIAQAFWLGCSETCIRKWRGALKVPKSAQTKLDRLRNAR